jgi:hypothetical protein
MNKISQVFLMGLFVSSSIIVAQEDSTSGTGEPSVSVAEQIDELTGKLNGLEETYLETKGTVEKLSKIKVSGYLQTQLRYAVDTAGQMNANRSNKYSIGDFQGGALPAASQSVFQIRRARIKTAYETSISQMVIQLDCLPFTTTSSGLKGGGISLKDAYLRFTDPWLKSLSFKAGVFDRPFGFEISYSSSTRESPERSRVFQTLFPGERDMGFSLEFKGSEKLPEWTQYINFKGGMFAGNGINIEFDDLRDMIGRLGFTIPLNDLNLSIDGGVSGYNGMVRNRNDTLYTVKGEKWTSTVGNFWKDQERKYGGLDLQLTYGNLPVLGGVALRGEYIQGQQPSVKNSNGSTKSDIISTAPVYLRNVQGFYGMLVLNVDPLRTQLVGKYDMFDPNTDLETDNVTNAADLKYSTIAGGLVFHWNDKVKFTLYYDKVINEETKAPSLALYSKDLNDDVITFRIQYKF